MAAPTIDELPACPVETTLSVIRSKWQVLILRDLMANGTMRFKELQRSIGKVSQKVLTDNLRAMEDYGIVHREVFAEVPPRVEYSLTETGQTLQPVLDAMWAWGEGYKERLRSSE
jgi:DNA-binding HxlR family transcriptional regulator